MPVSEATYLQLALEDFEGQWELVCGELRRKPGMTLRHNSIADWIGSFIRSDVGPEQYRIAVNSARVRAPAGNHYIPDVAVIPAAMLESRWEDTGVEAYAEPLPLIVEVWSPSTGAFDAGQKLTDFQARGDLEIWLVDYRSRAVTSWLRQPDGGYTRRALGAGLIRPAAVPGVAIDMAEVFRLARA